MGERTLRTPEEIAEGAVNRLCAYDAVDAPGSYEATADRISDFMVAFVARSAQRLAEAVHNHGLPATPQQGEEGSP